MAYSWCCRACNEVWFEYNKQEHGTGRYACPVCGDLLDLATAENLEYAQENARVPVERVNEEEVAAQWPVEANDDDYYEDEEEE